MNGPPAAWLQHHQLRWKYMTRSKFGRKMLLGAPDPVASRGGKVPPPHSQRGERLGSTGMLVSRAGSCMGGKLAALFKLYF